MSTGEGAGIIRWRLRDPYAWQKGIHGFPPIVATVLAARGITTRPQAGLFYKPHLAPGHDPLLLPGMREAIDRTARAIAAGELIALYGDFDVDGVTSLAVLQNGLSPLGARTLPYIPDRFQEGYGLNERAISDLHARGASLIITADCGISSVPEVAHANALGADVIILDHHTVPDELPAALAAVNPKRRDSPYPFDELAAVGVAFRFLQVLCEHLGRPLDDDSLIDLVALGTVVDVAPLTGENRSIVAKGLGAMQRNPRPGVDALATTARTAARHMGADSLGFGLGPRLNAAGRLSHAQRALDLLLAPDRTAARLIAEELDGLNRQRREQTETAVTLAEELCDPFQPLIMVGSGEIHAGIVGLVASRLAEKYYRPSIVFERGPETSRASARSIPGFDIIGAIRREKDLLVRHGGHRAAAGFTVRNEHVDALRERLVNTAAELLSGETLRPVVDVDAEASLGDLAGIEIKGLMGFEPCGNGNPKPRLLSRGVRVVDSRPVGAGGRHLKLVLKDGPATWHAIAFRRGGEDLAGEIDVVYSLSRDLDGERLQLELLDFAPSAANHPLELGR